MTKGFTIIEVLTVTSIILLITLVVLLSYRTGSSQLNLQRSANKIAQDISRTRDLAMNTKEFEDQIPPGGYGIHIRISSSDSSYIIYADMNGDGQYDYDSPDRIVETCYLEEGIFLKSVSPSNLSINFLAPDPEVTFSGGVISAAIELAITSDSDETKTITVNSLGLITIE